MTQSTSTTRERILDAAERLFADRGFEGTSIRAIISQARVNLAATHYHFGSKEALLEAVLARRISHVNAARLRKLDEVEAAAAPHSPSIEQILTAFIVPTVEFAEQNESGATFVRLMSRTFTEPRFSLTDFLSRTFGDTIARFSGALVHALPHLPREVVLWRAFFVIGAMTHFLLAPGKIDLLFKGFRGATSYAGTTRYLIEFAAAGMGAPLGAAAPKVRKNKRSS